MWLFFLKTAEHFSGASNSRKLGFYREPAESASTSKDVCHLHFITNLLKWLYDFEPTDSTLWKFAWVILKPWPNTGVLRTLLKARIPGSHLKSTDLETQEWSLEIYSFFKSYLGHLKKLVVSHSRAIKS